MSELVLDIKQFTTTPGGRFRVSGSFSGEEFREDYLIPALNKAIDQDTVLSVVLDGVCGYPSSFLSEVFGGLLSAFSRATLKNHLRLICTEEPYLIEEIECHLSFNENRDEVEVLQAALQHIAGAVAVYENSTKQALSLEECREVISQLGLSLGKLHKIHSSLDDEGVRYWSGQAHLALRSTLDLKNVMTSHSNFPSAGFVADDSSIGLAQSCYVDVTSIIKGLSRMIEHDLPEPIKVFISYTHDTQKHSNRVLKLAQQLREDGLDCQIDQFVNGGPANGWPMWMNEQINRADYVVIICTEIYLQRFNREGPQGLGLGGTWEALLTLQDLYEGQGINRKFIPGYFETPEFIPKPLRAATHYQLMKQYEDLLRYLTSQPAVIPKQIGPQRSLPPKK